ncbi:hypothetical protein Tsubulata_007928 [Turnera subulata]|uniref:Beta-glucosidase n=1 Tax=Turnera subulata TaxID=218843 RepID=A0A9Q0FQ16_9ROSI|nr:hypothetical protein Tsubulata_007928 [Turnera subulata]
MAIPGLGLLVLGCLLALFTEPTTAGFNPSEFPNGFYFGSATSAYQVEGSANKSGRGPSVWDTFAHEQPGRILDRSNGDVAVDFYHRYKEDLKRMKDTGLNAFRFSISWSRVIPHGQIRAGVNEEGIRFYNSVINEALKIGLEPFVTIFHWDTPQALEDKYGGFLSKNIVSDFLDYAEFLFRTFGDRVRHWITLNEPWAYAAWGFDTGEFAPGRCSKWVNEDVCKVGNSSTEPYIVAHHLLLSHAAAVKVYRQKYKATQKGKIGFTLDSYWFEPYSKDTRDIDAAKRSIDFHFGCLYFDRFMDPVTFGDYPRTMRDYVKERLPKFTFEESAMVKGSLDFLGVNYYSARFAANVEHVDPKRLSYTNDARRELRFSDSSGNSIGPEAGLTWLRVAPYGIRYLLNYTKDTYRNPEIFVTENGVAHDNETATYDEIIHDKIRIDYYDSHLGNISVAMRDYGVNIKGFFAWSFMDNFEWSSGYTKRFGLTYVDYNNNLTRIPKDSSKWFSNKLRSRSRFDYKLKLPRALGFMNYAM